MSVVFRSVVVMKKEPPEGYAEAIATLAEGNELARMGEVLQATSIATICDEYQIDEDVAVVTAEQIVYYGADGTASVGEFVALEVSAVLGISPGSAINRIAEVLNVRDRHPVLWDAMLAGTIRFFQAARVAEECVKLSATQVAEVDAKCAAALPMWPWARVLKELPRWILTADPDAAKAREVVARSERKVHVSGIKDGQVEVFCRLAPADGIAFDTAISQIAAGLPMPELPADIQALGLAPEQAQRIALNARRSAAVGELARSAFGQDALPAHELIVTIDASQIPADPDGELSGVARVEKLGDLIATQLPELFANSKVVVRPVIDPSTFTSADAHDPSRSMRLALNVRDPYSVEPFGSTLARSCDADHTVAYQPGRRGQTHLGNLGNLSRFAHRAKTAGKVRVDQVRPGL